MRNLSLKTTKILSTDAPLANNINTQMDPRLQRLIVQRRMGNVHAAGVSTTEDEVSVIARVTNVAQWEALSEVRVGATIGPDTDGSMIVTGRIPIARIEQVRIQPFVLSLKAAQPLRPALQATTQETGARPDLLPQGNLSNRGAGVVVGIIDYGCDFAHQNFRNANGTTRLMGIWDQTNPSATGGAFGYGRLFSQDEINQALQANDPYLALGYGPERDRPGSIGTHGTHVMDIAAGNGRGSQTPGVAANADLLFVHVSHKDVPFTGNRVVTKALGDSVILLEALKFIFDQAGNRPCVINLSLGTNGGPHDGSTLVEKGIDSLIRQQPNRAVVIAASNSFDDGIHAQGQVPNQGALDLQWHIPTNDFSLNEFELWYDGQDRFGVELIAPDGQTQLVVPPGGTDGLRDANGNVVVFISNRLNDPNNGDNMIGIFMEAGLPAGVWTVRLHGDQVQNGAFHAWIERDNGDSSQFGPPHNNGFTVGSISCGEMAVIVGSYDGHKPNVPISFFSSAGPTRDNREKPDVSAPGHGVFAAHSRTKTGVVSKSGTSMAAPAVAGIIALMLAEARQRGLDLNGDEILKLVIEAARDNPPVPNAWDARYGHGRLSASKLVQDVMALAGAGAGVPIPVAVAVPAGDD